MHKIQWLFLQASKFARNIFSTNIMYLKTSTGIKIWTFQEKNGGMRLWITKYNIITKVINILHWFELTCWWFCFHFVSLLFQVNHKPRMLSQGKLRQVAGLSDIDRFFNVELMPLLIPRVSGTPGSLEAQRVSSNIDIMKLTSED